RLRLPREQVAREARGGLRHEHPVHAQRAGPQLAAEARRAEGEPPREAGCQLGPRIRVARVDAGDERLEVGARGLVGVLCGPGAGRLDDVDGAHQTASTMRASSCEITGSASLPAWRTSAWLSGSGEVPAARLVMRERPSTSIPASRAAIASSAVDMPTMWPPSVLASCTSAGVS